MKGSDFLTLWRRLQKVLCLLGPACGRGEAMGAGLSLFWGREVIPNKMENHSLSYSSGRLATYLIL